MVNKSLALRTVQRATLPPKAITPEPSAERVTTLLQRIYKIGRLVKSGQIWQTQAVLGGQNCFRGCKLTREHHIWHLGYRRE